MVHIGVLLGDLLNFRSFLFSEFLHLRHHLQEQVVALELVLHQRVALRVAAEAHRLLQELDGHQVLLPQVVRLGEHEEALRLLRSRGDTL